MKSPLFRKSWPLLAVLVLSACGGGGSEKDDGGPPAAPPAPLDTVGTVFGKVLDSATAVPLVGATVKAAGKTAFTGTDGSYLLENLPLGRVAVVVTSTSHAEQTVIAELNANQGRQQLAVLPVAVGTTLSFDATLPQTLADTRSTARVTLPAGALVAANGSAPVGAVKAKMTRIDPGADAGAMPGDYRSTGGRLQSYGAVTVSFTDAGGQALNLAAGKTATLRIPVASGLMAPPATSPLFWFNSSTGLWVREGQAALVGSGAGAYYEGVVSHFSTWNADDEINTVQVTGRVVNENGSGVPGVTVASAGVNYVGFATAVTDVNGNFSLPMKAGATADVLAILNDVESVVQRVTSAAANVTLPNTLLLPSAAAYRLSLGAPVAVENLGIAPASCCRFFNVRVPFSTNGLRLPYPATGNRLDARWELRHRFEQDVATPEVVCRSVFGTVPGGEIFCKVDGVEGSPLQQALSTPYIQGDYGVARIDNGTGATSGSVEFFLSAHIGGFAASVTPRAVTYDIVLAVDVTDAATGRVITVRSEPRTVSIRF
ncbi:MAG: hypothetical protein Q8K45_13185 [Rubrivivax sp.]|nr:hypothetical protein [Rubrivivax sp.]